MPIDGLTGGIAPIDGGTGGGLIDGGIGGGLIDGGTGGGLIDVSIGVGLSERGSGAGPLIDVGSGAPMGTGVPGGLQKVTTVRRLSSGAPGGTSSALSDGAPRPSGHVDAAACLARFDAACAAAQLVVCLL